MKRNHWKKLSIPSLTIANVAAIAATSISSCAFFHENNEDEPIEPGEDNEITSVKITNGAKILASLSGYSETELYEATVQGIGDFDDEITWSIDWEGYSIEIDSETGLLEWSNNMSRDTYNFNVIATSAFDQTKQDMMPVSLTIGNSGQIVDVSITSGSSTLLGEVGVEGNETYGATVIGIGYFSDVVTWSLNNAPTGVTINSSTGVLTWNTTSTATSHSFEVVATSAINGSKTGTKSIELTIDQAPTITDITITGSQSIFGSTNLSGSTSYEAEVKGMGIFDNSVVWSLDGEPENVVVESLTNTTGQISWTNEMFAGTYNFNLIATSVEEPSISKTKSLQLTISSDAEVGEVTIFGEEVIETGLDNSGSEQYTAVLKGAGDYDERVLWYLVGASSGIDIDSQTGVLTWDNTLTAKTYNFMIKAKSYNNPSVEGVFEVKLKVLPVSVTSYLIYDDGTEKTLNFTPADISKLCDSGKPNQSYVYTIGGVNVVRSQLTGIVFGQNFLTETSISYDNFLQSMFGESTCTSLKVDFRGLNSLISVGHNFAQYMFAGCNNLISLSRFFTLPANLQAVGTFFGYQMFSKCRALTTIPENFNIPQTITNVNGFFLASMFQDCSALVGMSKVFSLPPIINSTTMYFTYNMFKGCISLQTISPVFNFPSVTGNDEDHFASGMFFGCSSLQYDVSSTNPLIFPSPAVYSLDFGAECFSYATILNQEPNNVPANVNPGAQIKIARS